MRDFLKKILIVDDEVLISTDLENRITSLGYTVCGNVTSGKKAIESVEKNRPDLVLMDIVLKGEMDGVQAAEVIKERWGIPIVFQTAYADEERLRRAKMTYPFGYLLKPVHDRDLKVTLELALYVAEAEREKRKAAIALSESEGAMQALLNATSDAAILIDIEGGIVALNKNAAVLIDAEPSQAIGKCIWDFWEKEVSELRKGRAAEVVKKGMPICFEDIRNNRHITNHIYPVFDNENRVKQLALFGCDRTEQKKIENDLMVSEKKYRELFENMEQGAFYQRNDGGLIDVNESALRIFGLTRDQFMGRTSLDPEWKVVREDGTEIPGDEHPSMVAIKTGKPVKNAIAGVLNPNTKDYAWININAIPQFRPGENAPYQVFVTIHDITRQKLAEDEIKKSEIEKQVALDVMNLINASESVDDLAKIITGKLRRMVGVEAVGLRVCEGYDYPYYVTKGFSEEFVKAEKNLCARDMNGQLLRDEVGKPVLECMCGNILSERFDPELPFFTENGSFWTNSTTKLLAETSEEELQTRTRKRCNGEGYESMALIPLKARNETFGLIQFNDSRKGVFSEHMIKMIERIADNIANSIAIQFAQDKIKRALKEKVTLLEELNHRVKNNMQVIISLMNLQADKVNDTKLKDAIKEAQNRIYAISSVHETLHQSNNLSNIELSSYLTKLTDTIIKTYTTGTEAVLIETEIQFICIELEKSYPLGLVINEFLSNSLKYAFPEGEMGIIRIEGKQKDENTLLLQYSDNGIGMPKEVSWRDTDSLGLQIIRILIEEQLDGTLELESGEGTKWILTIPI